MKNTYFQDYKNSGSLFFFLFLFLSYYANAFAVSPSVIDFGDVKQKESKNSGFYVFNPENNNLSLVLDYVGEDWIELENKLFDISENKRFIDVKLNVPAGAEEGRYSGKIYAKEISNNERISLNKVYSLKVFFNVVDGVFADNKTFAETKEESNKDILGFVGFTKADIGKVTKVSFLFKNNEEEDYFLLKGEVFVDDVFYTLVQSDIVSLGEGEKKLINLYFTPEMAGAYDLHLKVVGEDYESDEKKISFVLEEKSFLDKFNRNSLFFIGLCFVVVLLAVINIFIFFRKWSRNR